VILHIESPHIFDWSFITALAGKNTRNPAESKSWKSENIDDVSIADHCRGVMECKIFIVRIVSIEIKQGYYTH
jgi:hypothetical protein